MCIYIGSHLLLMQSSLVTGMTEFNSKHCQKYFPVFPEDCPCFNGD